MRKIFTAVIIFALLIFLLSIVERVFWPKISFVSSHKLETLTQNDFNSLRNQCGEPLEAYIGSKIINIRCGMFWPFITTYEIETDKAAWFMNN